MIDAKLIRAMLMFHFLTNLDEVVAKSEAIQTLATLRRRLGHGRWSESEKLQIFVEILVRGFRSKGGVAQKGQPLIFDEKQWHLPKGFVLGPWLEFRKSATPDEFLAVLLVKALCLDLDLVAEQLGVTPGTLNYRISRGLRKLGVFAQVGMGTTA